MQLTQQAINGNRPTRTVGNSRYFGGSNTSPRRMKNLAYAWRNHHRSRKPEPFFFNVTRTPASNGDVSRNIKRKAARGGNYTPSSVIGFVTRADRERGIIHFTSLGFNHFTLFRDVNAEFALMIGRAGSWLAPGEVWVNR